MTATNTPLSADSNQAELPERAPDFGCEATESFGQILGTLDLTLMLTSYQTNRLILIRSTSEELHLSVKAFPRPMGIAIDRDRMVMGTHSQLIDFRRFDGIAGELEPAGNGKTLLYPTQYPLYGYDEYPRYRLGQ